MYESISKNNELENEMTLDMSYFWYSDACMFEYEEQRKCQCLLLWTVHPEEHL